ncbi:protein of unknown function [Candidatus Nitrosocosmicus franklandus]|uniref:Uncharacterized protein n=1 Tax=Candidatus Nitrosocosmicus franklandianus TaxID=1798806 RepID=A0A484ID75_9ARCH|nr:protein of unknown function [Candidatus Nitrosocosmicus franklandus]
MVSNVSPVSISIQSNLSSRISWRSNTGEFIQSIIISLISIHVKIIKNIAKQADEYRSTSLFTMIFTSYVDAVCFLI